VSFFHTFSCEFCRLFPTKTLICPLSAYYPVPACIHQHYTAMNALLVVEWWD